MRRLSPTFLYGAFFFVASALADVPSASLHLRGKRSTKFSTPNVVFGIITMNLDKPMRAFMERPKIIA